MSKLLLDEQPLMILPQLALRIGLNEAIVLQQIHYWLLKKEHHKDERYWVYNTYEGWQENFPFWSVATIKRALTALRKPYDPKEGDRYIKRPPLLIATSKYNKKKYDKTLWYTIDYEALDSIENPQVKMTQGSKCPEGTGQDDPMDEAKMTPPIPETSTETNSEITEEIPDFPEKTPAPSPGGGDGVDLEQGGDANGASESLRSASEHSETGGRVGGKGKVESGGADSGKEQGDDNSRDSDSGHSVVSDPGTIAGDPDSPVDDSQPGIADDDLRDGHSGGLPASADPVVESIADDFLNKPSPEDLARRTAAARADAGGNWADAGEDALAAEAITCLFKGNPPRKDSGTWQDLVNTLKPLHADWGLHDMEADKALSVVRAAIALFLDEKPQMAVYKYPSFDANYGQYLSRAMNGDRRQTPHRNNDPAKYDEATRMTLERLNHGNR